MHVLAPPGIIVGTDVAITTPKEYIFVQVADHFLEPPVLDKYHMNVVIGNHVNEKILYHQVIQRVEANGGEPADKKQCI